MKDKQAKALDAILRDLPKNDDAFALRHMISTRGLSELSPESRCDVSWITVETPDHAGDLVLASGMDDSIYQLNPIVTMNHRYDEPPVGRSLWRRKVREGSLVGVKAKTYYLPKPKTWSSGDWPADTAFELVKAGLLRGKSIGFIPLQLRAPTQEEIDQNPQLQTVRHVITRWLLLEYACCYLPMQPFALVEEVSKSSAVRDGDESHKTLQIPSSDARMAATQTVTTRPELVRALTRLLASPTFGKIFDKALQRTFQKRCGLV